MDARPDAVHQPDFEVEGASSPGLGVASLPDAEPRAGRSAPPAGLSSVAPESGATIAPQVTDTEATTTEADIDDAKAKQDVLAGVTQPVHPSAPVGLADVPTIHISTPPADQPLAGTPAGEGDTTTVAEATPAHDHSPVPMLNGGVPMPVSADPSVPDPASIHDTPVSAGSPASPADADESAVASPTSPRGYASAIPPALFKHLSGHKSFSGLFTPMSEAGSSPVSSAHNSAQSDDGIQEEGGEDEEVDELADEVVDEAAAEVEVEVGVEDEVVIGAVVAEEAITSATSPTEPSEVVEETTATETAPPETVAPAAETSPEVLTEFTSAVKPNDDALIHDAADIDIDADGEIDLDYHPTGDFEHPTVQLSPARPHEGAQVGEEEIVDTRNEGDTAPASPPRPAGEVARPLSAAPEGTSDANGQPRVTQDVSDSTEPIRRYVGLYFAP